MALYPKLHYYTETVTVYQVIYLPNNSIEENFDTLEEAQIFVADAEYAEDWKIEEVEVEEEKVEERYPGKPHEYYD